MMRRLMSFFSTGPVKEELVSNALQEQLINLLRHLKTKEQIVNTRKYMNLLGVLSTTKRFIEDQEESMEMMGDTFFSFLIGINYKINGEQLNELQTFSTLLSKDPEFSKLKNDIEVQTTRLCRYYALLNSEIIRAYMTAKSENETVSEVFAALKEKIQTISLEDAGQIKSAKDDLIKLSESLSGLEEENEIVNAIEYWNKLLEQYMPECDEQAQLDQTCNR